MDSALIGILFLVAIIHAVLVVIPLIHTMRAPISIRSKLAWSVFLLLPFIGVLYFHKRFRSSLFLGKAYRPRSQDMGAPPSGFSRRDHDDVDL